MNNQFNLFEKLGEYFRPGGPMIPQEFYNTIGLKNPELKEAKAQTGLQDQRVLDLFKLNGQMTPVECHRAYCSIYPDCPLTSIRRSITVLTGRGLLEKTDEMKPGIYGKKNFVWKIKN